MPTAENAAAAAASATVREGGLGLFAPAGVRLSYWHEGERTAHHGTAFWQLVTRYVDLVEARPQLGDFVLIISRTNADMMALFVALIAARRLVSFFPPASPIQDERSYFEQQRGALARIAPTSILIFDPACADTIARIDAQLAARLVLLPQLSGAAVQHPRAADGERGLRLFQDAMMSLPDRALFVQHSSGTTGIKKAVAISAAALRAQFMSYWPAVRQIAGDEVRVATWLPLYHDMGLLAGFLLPLMAGASISILDPFEWIGRPGELFEMIERDKCNVCWLPNFAFRHLSRLRAVLPERRLGSVRAWIDCSEPCRYRDAREFELTFAPHGVAERSVVGCYAMAETVFAVTQLLPCEQRALILRHEVTVGDDLSALGAAIVTGPGPVDDATRAVLSSGRAIPGIDIRIYADDKAVAREGIYGEIGMRGSFVFEGYRGLGPHDSRIGDDGYFRAGDLGAIIDGHLYVFGRVSERIIVNGKNVFAGDIEDIVNSVVGIKPGRVVAFGLDNEQTGSEDLIIVAERDDSATIAANTMRSAITRLVVDTFLIHPRDVRIVDARWLVKSTSGKISRRENRLRYIEAFQGR